MPGLFKKMLCVAAAAATACADALAPGCAFYSSTLDWAVDIIQNNYYLDVPEDAVRAAWPDDLSDVLDRYSCYYTAEEYASVRASNAGSRSGIGVSYQYIPEESGFSGGSGVYIVSVLGNSPAERGGMRPGEFVQACVAADGTRAEIDDGDDFSAFISARAEGEQFTVVTDRGAHVVYRSAYTMSYCAMATADAEWSVRYDGDGARTVVRSESSRYSYLPEGAAYVSLSQFYGDAAEEMAQLIYRYNEEGCTSLILDLRNNGGGSVEVMQKLAYLFTGDVQGAYRDAMYALYKDGSRENYEVRRFTTDSSCLLPAGTPVTVLANNSTASASEALIGVLVANGVADFGDIWVSDFSQSYLDFTGTADKNRRTYGKGIMQRTYLYYTGEALKLTVARICWPDDACIHDRGVGVADGCNVSPAEWSVTYSDEELAFVVRALGEDSLAPAA